MAEETHSSITETHSETSRSGFDIKTWSINIGVTAVVTVLMNVAASSFVLGQYVNRLVNTEKAIVAVEDKFNKLEAADKDAQEKISKSQVDQSATLATLKAIDTSLGEIKADIRDLRSSRR